MSHTDPFTPWKILLAVDGSNHCLTAAALLHDLPWPPGSQVTLLAVQPRRLTQDGEALRAALATVRDIVQGEHLAVSEELLEGHPAAQLTSYADAHQPDLVVVGAQGLRATLGILLGGVAQQVVEYANRPVLVVRTTANRPQLRRLLVAIDSSCAGKHVIDYVGRLPMPPEAVIGVMHVLPPLAVPNNPPPTWLLGRPPEMFQLYPETELALARAAVEKGEGETLLAQAAHALPGRGVDTILARGDAATEILERARDQKANLVVAGSRGLSAVPGWWFGSVSRKLVHHAPCSVLIIKDQPA